MPNYKSCGEILSDFSAELRSTAFLLAFPKDRANPNYSTIKPVIMPEYK